MCSWTSGESRERISGEMVSPPASNLFDRGVDVEGVPPHDRIHRHTQCSELILHPVPVAVPELAEAPEEDPPPECVAALADVELDTDHAPVCLGVDELQQVQGLEDPAIVRERVAEAGHAVAGGHHPQQVVRADLAGLQGPGDAEHVLPVLPDPLDLDALARDGLQRPVVLVRSKRHSRASEMSAIRGEN